MSREAAFKSIGKVIFRLSTGSVATAGLVWLITGRLDAAMTVGGLLAAGQIIRYYLRERPGDRTSFGGTESAVLWFTGLSGSGKSTIAEEVCRHLRRHGVRVEYLDGDAIRDVFPATGFTRAERDAHVRRVGFLASRLEEHGVFVVAALVSPYADSRQFVKRLCKNFVEIHVSTPFAECERRDVKGLYARARRGEIKGFTGLDDPYEPPPYPDLVLDTTAVSLAEATSRVLRQIEHPRTALRFVQTSEPVSIQS